MTSDAAPEQAPDPAAARRERSRFVARAMRLTLALGVGSAVCGAVASGSVVTPLHDALQALPDGAREVAVIALWRLWVLVVVPLASYVAARLLRLRPWIAALAVAGSGELVFVLLDLATVGVEGLYRSPVWLLGRVATFALGVGAGTWLASRGRAASLKRQSQLEAEAAATRARYAAWLEQQAKPPPQ
jgi:hypothetical protein